MALAGKYNQEEMSCRKWNVFLDHLLAIRSKNDTSDSKVPQCL